MKTKERTNANRVKLAAAIALAELNKDETESEAS